MPDPTWPTPEAVEAVARTLNPDAWNQDPWEYLDDHGHDARTNDGPGFQESSRARARRSARAALAAAEPFIAARETTAKRDAWNECARATARWHQDQRYYSEDEVPNPYAQEAPL